MKKAIAAAYGAVVGLLISVAHDQVFLKFLKWPESASITGSIAIGILLLVAYEIIGGSKTIVRRFSPISRVEGAWKIALTNNQERPTSVCKIYFSLRDHIYKGYGINSDGTLGSEWSSRDVHYDENKDELLFTSDATLIKNGSRVRNYGYIKFFRNADGKYDYGSGYFVDINEQLTQTNMTLVKIPDHEFDQLVKESFLKTKVSEGQFAQLGAQPDAAR